MTDEPKSSKHATGTAQRSVTKQEKKRSKKGIFISYSPDASFTEKKFVLETVHQLKENNLWEDIWFDYDEEVTDSPCWFASRMEAVERCRAAIIFLSHSYFSCPVSLYEGKVLLSREKIGHLRCYPVLYSLHADTDVPRTFTAMLSSAFDLTGKYAKESLAEKSSLVVGTLMVKLENYLSTRVDPKHGNFTDDNSDDYQSKKMCRWTTNDLQDWLFKLGINEFYRQSFAEYMVNGFLLMSISDQDMIKNLGIDSRAVRRKIMQQIMLTLNKELEKSDRWHLRARAQRSKNRCAYIIYDPVDVRLVNKLKTDLSKKGLTVMHHTKLGGTKEEFLQVNGSQMATVEFVVVILTTASVTSPFFFQEVLFSDWLGKKMVTAMFNNVWKELRPSLQTVLGDYSAVDFETCIYEESLGILQHFISPPTSMAGVILEQSYIDKMSEGLKCLALLASNPGDKNQPQGLQVYLSYHWDSSAKVEQLRQCLDDEGYSSSSDSTALAHRQYNSGPASTSDAHKRSNIRSARVLLCCVNPTYLQTDSCIKDVLIAESMHKPVIPVLLHYCPWPPDHVHFQVRKVLMKQPIVDLSTDRAYRENLPVLLRRIGKVSGM